MHALDEKVNWQSDIQSIPDRLWDVVIIGAGPAGAIAACHLAAAHYKVLLLDRKKFPREKVCGDGLLPDALSCLDAIGVGQVVREAGHTLNSSVLVSPSGHETEIRGEYVTIKRCHLDMIVAQKAVEFGAIFALGEVKQLAVEPDGLVSCTIQGCDRLIQGRIGIVATGVDIRLIHKMNWPARKKPSAVGLRCYVRSSLVLDRLVVSFEINEKYLVYGYGWIFPMRDGEFNVGFGILTPRSIRKRKSNLKNGFEFFIDSFPPAKELMKQSDRTTPLRAAALRYDFEGAYPFVNGPIVAVGETIGTTLPFLGEGIGKAMESGHLAAEVISEALHANDLNTLSQYNQQIDSKFRSHYKGYRMAERWLSRPRLNDFVLGRFGSSKYAQEVLAGVIAETKRPHEIFSLKGILKSFFK